MAKQVITSLGSDEQAKANFVQLTDPKELELYKLDPSETGLTKENLASEAGGIIQAIVQNYGFGVAGNNSEIQFNKFNKFGASQNFRFGESAAHPGLSVTGSLGIFVDNDSTIQVGDDASSNLRINANTDDGRINIFVSADTVTGSVETLLIRGNPATGTGTPGNIILMPSYSNTDQGHVGIGDNRGLHGTAYFNTDNVGADREVAFQDKDGTFAYLDDAVGFQTIRVAGQDDVVAGTADTLVLIATGGTSLTTDASGKSVTIDTFDPSSIPALDTLNSGTYTPTVTNSTNTDSAVTCSPAQWMSVGTTVTVSGRFTADPTTGATPTSFEIDLPFSTNLGNAYELAGVAFCGGVAGMGAEIIGVPANDTAKFQWIASDVTSKTWSYTFTYQII